MTLYWGAGAALLVYLALAWVTGSFLHLDTTRFYILFAILAMLGISATAIFFWYRSRKTGSGAAGAAASTGGLGTGLHTNAIRISPSRCRIS